MSHGEFKDNQAMTVSRYVKNKVVHDLGAGDLTLSHALVDLGAEKVVAIDKVSPMPFAAQKRLRGIEIVSCYFHDYKKPIETAFVSWPVNWYDYALGSFLEKAEMVIYLGSNVDGSACGYPDMWVALAQRQVLAHIPHRKNTLIVYGPEFVKRDQLPEEYAALNQGRMYQYEELYYEDDCPPIGGFRESQRKTLASYDAAVMADNKADIEKLRKMILTWYRMPDGTTPAEYLKKAQP